MTCSQTKQPDNPRGFAERVAASDDPSDSPDKVHIYVLETDEPHPETQDRKGFFGDIIHDLFVEAGARHDPRLDVTTSTHYIVDDPANDNHGKVPKAADIPETVRAVLITGSMYDAHGDDPWIKDTLALLRELWTTRPKMLFSGVCFGHQILSRMLGATVENHPHGKWELSHTEMDLSPVGRRLFQRSESDEGKLYLHQMHQDQVTSVPSSSTTDLLSPETKVHVWASTPHTGIQGLYIRDRLFSSQGHLELDEDMVHRQIEMRQESSGIDDGDGDVAAEAKERAHLKHDGLVVAGAILRFFHGDDHDVD